MLFSRISNGGRSLSSPKLEPGAAQAAGTKSITARLFPELQVKS